MLILIFVSGTSKVCEQLFSKAKHVMTPTRRRMDSLTLEAFLLLKIDSDLWATELIEEILDEAVAARKYTPSPLNIEC